jgi:hypothetical protein
MVEDVDAAAKREKAEAREAVAAAAAAAEAAALAAGLDEDAAAATAAAAAAEAEAEAAAAGDAIAGGGASGGGAAGVGAADCGAAGGGAGGGVGVQPAPLFWDYLRSRDEAVAELTRRLADESARRAEVEARLAAAALDLSRAGLPAAGRFPGADEPAAGLPGYFHVGLPPDGPPGPAAEAGLGPGQQPPAIWFTKLRARARAGP